MFFCAARCNRTSRYTLTDDFDADFGVDEWHGTNALFRNGDRIFRTYFVNSRGDEANGRLERPLCSH